MERKQHWSGRHFAEGLVPRERLRIHFEQEYRLFVRDFPIMVARAYAVCPVKVVRADLAANIYEEETGGISAGRPHPELFLEIPKGFGFDVTNIDDVVLLPGSRAYRDILDDLTLNHGWEVAVAVVTIFIEGTAWERGEVEDGAPKRPVPPLEQHPLHKHYQLPLEALALPKAHREVEGEHRSAAWTAILDHVAAERRHDVVAAMDRACAGWMLYKDAVAEACGLTPLTD